MVNKHLNMVHVKLEWIFNMILLTDNLQIIKK
jgi:hypothetical protein